MADITKTPESGKNGWSTGTKVLVGIIALVIVIAVIAVVTLTVAVLETRAGTEFPYTTNYRVTLPDGEPISIGSSRILVTSYNDELIADVDGTREKLVIGQERVISPGMRGSRSRVSRSLTRISRSPSRTWDRLPAVRTSI